jgi:hypothetical protein
MMTHTKGPWKAERNASFSYSIQTDYVHDRGHDCNVVREVRCEANAFLISAAPELLDALQAAQQEFLGLSSYLATCDPVTIVQNLDAVIASLKAKQTKAEAAIRKAKGELA